VTAEQSVQNDRRERPLLLIVSDGAELPARARSGTRQLCRWTAHPDADDETGFSGDPTDSACFEWLRDARSVTAVIDLQPVERARAVLHALRSVRPDAAVLLLSADAADLDHEHDGTLARGGDLRDVLRIDLDEELERLESERRAFCLRSFAAGEHVVPILIHNDPDPDAVSSAFGIMTLLGGSPDRTPIVTFAQMTRPENRRMADLLHIRVTEITPEELRSFERVITVDTQPRDLQHDGMPRFAVVDHHPPEQSYTAEFLDIRPEYGAAATMVTEYLRASDRRVGKGLATSLLLGIRTDTDSLTRGVTAADVDAFAYLQERADKQLVRRLQRPSYPMDTARAFGRALDTASSDDDLCVAYLGELDHEQAHALADLADFCLAIENITWVAVGALFDDELVITLRHIGAEPGAGELARALSADGGSGGGHASMGRVMLPRDEAERRLGTLEAEQLPDSIRRLVEEALEELSAAGTQPT
jgi:nanoRNase/pAp phosphatase (c-di-AMP/oligoRNAs hydrolase)